MGYQLLNSLIVAIGHHSGIAQLTCLVILELAYLIIVNYFKPLERNLANIFNITFSAGRLIVPFLGGILQSRLLLGYCVNYHTISNGDENADLNQTQEAGDDNNNLSIKEN
ncbi:unnamed protein product [Rhizophagus irregularis]|uniref:TRP C-terminal domain-containing protein n=1 Tax=Rhizophagus irregularis TaxID=588596 RepID=A0A2I1H740_9GLOM|nr:hypothetical protein RhiirA4_473591 [Rhizophagus irregularis]CAB4408842.1 unnamed protein product [Rhizophagus irregularis]